MPILGWISPVAFGEQKELLTPLFIRERRKPIMENGESHAFNQL
jgi:hypothetical protein